MSITNINTINHNITQFQINENNQNNAEVVSCFLGGLTILSIGVAAYGLSHINLYLLPVWGSGFAVGGIATIITASAAKYYSNKKEANKKNFSDEVIYQAVIANKGQNLNELLKNLNQIQLRKLISSLNNGKNNETIFNNLMSELAHFPKKIVDSLDLYSTTQAKAQFGIMKAEEKTVFFISIIERLKIDSHDGLLKKALPSIEAILNREYSLGKTELIYDPNSIFINAAVCQSALNTNEFNQMLSDLKTQVLKSAPSFNLERAINGNDYSTLENYLSHLSIEHFKKFLDLLPNYAIRFSQHMDRIYSKLAKFPCKLVDSLDSKAKNQSRKTLLKAAFDKMDNSQKEVFIARIIEKLQKDPKNAQLKDGLEAIEHVLEFNFNDSEENFKNNKNYQLIASLEGKCHNPLSGKSKPNLYKMLNALKNS